MTAADQTIAELKAKIDLVEVVGWYVNLTKKGADLWGCCPFHSDRTPSFKVSAGRCSYHCFGCGAKGDALDFLMAHEGLNIADAIERLRELGGGTAKRNEPRAAEPEPDHNRNTELARTIWRQTETIADGLPFDYLTRRRGLTHWDCDRVRWHPACPWGRDRVGCIVAPVVDHRTGYTVGIWRIRPVMEGKVERLALGPTKGNCSPTWWPEGDELAIAEGIEDALAVFASDRHSVLGGTIGRQHGRSARHPLVGPIGGDLRRRGRRRPPWRPYLGRPAAARGAGCQGCEGDRA